MCAAYSGTECRGLSDNSINNVCLLRDLAPNFSMERFGGVLFVSGESDETFNASVSQHSQSHTVFLFSLSCEVGH